MQLLSRIDSLVELAERPGRETPEEIITHAVRCLDLTLLSQPTDDASLHALCDRAITTNVAAVCVAPSAVSLVAQRLRGTAVRCASVAMGFPDAAGSYAHRLREVHQVVQDGAQEVDIVVPIDLILTEQWDALSADIQGARDATANQTLKVILETGRLPDPSLIYRAARVALDAGADFIKTSTGTTAQGATHAAAAAMVLAIEDDGKKRGLKVSGGLRCLDDITPYIRLVTRLWPMRTFGPTRFRIGASSLLDALTDP